MRKQLLALVALLACGCCVAAGCNNNPDATEAAKAEQAQPKGQPLPPGNNLGDPSKPAAGYTGPETGRASSPGTANQGK